VTERETRRIARLTAAKLEDSPQLRCPECAHDVFDIKDARPHCAECGTIFWGQRYNVRWRYGQALVEGRFTEACFHAYLFPA